MLTGAMPLSLPYKVGFSLVIAVLMGDLVSLITGAGPPCMPHYDSLMRMVLLKVRR